MITTGLLLLFGSMLLGIGLRAYLEEKNPDYVRIAEESSKRWKISAGVDFMPRPRIRSVPSLGSRDSPRLFGLHSQSVRKSGLFPRQLHLGDFSDDEDEC